MARILDERLSWAWLRTYAGSFGSLILCTLGQIASVVLPSDRCIGMWDVEVPAEVAMHAAVVVAGVLGH